MNKPRPPRKPKALTEDEWELINALRNFRKMKHNPSVQFELYIDELVDRLKG